MPAESWVSVAFICVIVAAICTSVCVICAGVSSAPPPSIACCTLPVSRCMYTFRRVSQTYLYSRR